MALSKAELNSRRRMQRLIKDPNYGPKFKRLSASDKRAILELKGRAVRRQIDELDAIRRGKVARRSKFRRVQDKARRTSLSTLSPEQARDELFRKMQRLFSDNIKWSGRATANRISAMTDDQVYESLVLTKNEIVTVGREPTPGDWKSDSDYNQNVLWYHAE